MKTFLIDSKNIPKVSLLVGLCMTDGFTFSRLETLTQGVKGHTFIIEVSKKRIKEFSQKLKECEIFEFIEVNEKGKASRGKRVLGQFKEVAELNLNGDNYLYEGKTFSIV